MLQTIPEIVVVITVAHVYSVQIALSKFTSPQLPTAVLSEEKDFTISCAENIISAAYIVFLLSRTLDKRTYINRIRLFFFKFSFSLEILIFLKLSTEFLKKVK